jgi:hypothetical protein
MHRRGRALRLSARRGEVAREGRRSGGRGTGRTGWRGLQAPPTGRRGGRGLMAGRGRDDIHRAAAVDQGCSLRIRRGLAASPSGPGVWRGGGPGASLVAWAVAGLSRRSLARRLSPRRLATLQGARPGGAQAGGPRSRGSRDRHRRTRSTGRRGGRVVGQACEVEDRGAGARRELAGRGGEGWLSGRHVSWDSHRGPVRVNDRWGSASVAPSVRGRLGSRGLRGGRGRTSGRLGGRG